MSTGEPKPTFEIGDTVYFFGEVNKIPRVLSDEIRGTFTFINESGKEQTFYSRVSNPYNFATWLIHDTCYKTKEEALQAVSKPLGNGEGTSKAQ